MHAFKVCLPAFRLGVLALLVSLSSQAFGDFVVYTLPGTKLRTVFEGKAKVIAGRLVEYTHPVFGSIALSLDDAIVIKAATRQEEFRKLFQKAVKSNHVDDYLDAAKQAIKRGLLKEFYECCSAAYKVQPDHPVVVRLIEARKRVKKPLGGYEEVETKLREATNLSKMKVSTSRHYVMLHDTSDAKVGKKKQTRAETRLDLLETVYEMYFMKFALEGVLLEPPQEHMMVLLFADETTFHRYSTLLGPELTMAAGFWSPKDNIGVFYDQGTNRTMKLLTEIAEDLQKQKLEARGTAISKEVAHIANSIELLAKISREESDIEVVSHEATHQLAGNTGIMPMGKIGARWAHEGLASYFETPAGAGWGGIGAVNDTRLASYKVISRDPTRSLLELVVSDALFYAAKTQGEAVDAYGQAWALTYFLMETRFDKLIEYYRKCSELENDAAPRARIAVFTEIFGDLRVLERDFNLYMKTLKSDIDRMREAAKK